MDTNSNSIDAKRELAISYIADVFLEELDVQDRNMYDSENFCLEQGHKILSNALSIALESYDRKLCRTLDKGIKIHDRRKRTLATKLGDVTFSWSRCRDIYGNTIVPLADALDIQWNARVSPAARAFLVDAGADVSFSKSAKLLASAGGSSVSTSTVMKSVHKMGELCAKQDLQSAESLYCDGVIPEAQTEAKDICIEADGTWIKLQGIKQDEPQRVEIKALVSYMGKETQGTKNLRIAPVRHACVGTPEQFWTQGISTVAQKFDLSKIQRVHFGCDGESFYKQGSQYLLISIDSDTHLDPFHVNRSVLSCFFKEDKKLANNILGMVIDGDAKDAANLIEIAENEGIAKKNSSKVAAYLRNNAEIIYTPGPSLGTMESEQQHVYGARMDSVPCGWSVQGADAMARIRSRMFSKRKLPRLKREDSISPKRASKRKNRELAYLSKQGSNNIPKSVGSGYEAEHVVALASCSAEVRYTAGVDSGMVGIGW